MFVRVCTKTNRIGVGAVYVRVVWTMWWTYMLDHPNTHAVNDI